MVLLHVYAFLPENKYEKVKDELDKFEDIINEIFNKNIFERWICKEAEFHINNKILFAENISEWGRNRFLNSLLKPFNV